MTTRDDPPGSPSGARGEANRDMAIAVVGLALRFPGARDAAALWQNLAAGIDSITIGCAPEGHVAAAGVLDEIDAFDASFFRYTRPEAEQMDPQHRLFLETAWAALEAAGHAPRGTAVRAGVYAGCTASTYLLSNVLPRAAADGIGALELTLGSAGDFLATRVAYKLNLTGPAITVQTACSTSLVAVHLACQALLAGECDLALAGGASIRVPQLAAQRYQAGGALSPDGHCRAFDAGAAGTVAASGVGVVVLKRLADALADRDPIRAVILGTAINNDGSAKTGFTAPSVSGQAAAIGEALSMAGVAAAAISYVEAHGTATPLGDPIEVAALKRAFAGAPPRSCGLGSVKTNLGHLDAAAGIAGLIKTVLALEHQLLPPSLHFVEANPRLGLDDSPFFVVAAPMPWRGPVPLRAGVSASGIGGTNAHVVLEQPPAVTSDPPRRASELVLVSARTPAALDRITAALAEHLAGCADPLADVAHTLQVGRARFGARRFVVASDPQGAAASLRAGPVGGDACRTEHDAAERRGAVFVFPGSGVQRVNMGAELLAEPAFREAIDRCAELLRAEVGGDLRDVMFAGADREAAMAVELDRPWWSQLAIFACDWAIAQQWLAWGVRPEALLGHSLGEYVAACVAGVFSLEDALALVVARARLFEAMPAGGMVSILAAPGDIASLCGEALSLAAVNGPASCVVSGPDEALATLATALAARGVSFRRLRTQRAMHSAMLDPYLPGFARAVERVRLRPPVLPVASCVTGTWLAAADATDPAYWCRHLRQTVQFSDALACLLSGGSRAVIEAGPATTLTALARQHPASTGHQMIATLPATPGRARVAVAALGEAWLAGVDIDWERFRAGERRRRVVLPTYSFERDRYWLEAVVPPAAPTGAERRVAAPSSFAPVPAQEPRTPALAPNEPPASPAPSQAIEWNELEKALAACFHDLFRAGQIGLDDDFFALGGDSLLGLRLLAQIERRLGSRLALKDLVEAPTVRALAARIAPTRGATPAPAGPGGPAGLAGPAGSAGLSSPAGSLVTLHPGSRGAPVFFLHAVGGHVVFYRDLARAIDPGRAAYGVPAQGLEDGQRCHRTVEDMAAHYLAQVKSVAPRGPYLLVGSSFGGVIAYELGRRLSLEGHAVPLCALLDSPGPGYLPPPFADEADEVAAFVRDWLAIAPEQLRGGSVAEKLRRVLDEAARGDVPIGFSSIDEGLRLLAVWRANVEALRSYDAPAWPHGELQYVRAAERDPRNTSHPELAWIGRCARVTVEVAPGGHTSMLLPPHAESLGARLRAYLERGRAAIDLSVGSPIGPPVLRWAAEPMPPGGVQGASPGQGQGASG
jgi:acyl transferase domain-containing protein/thioesterase domain-containing protein